MPTSDVLGAHYVLRQCNPGRTRRLTEIIDEAHADEVTVRREIDALALEGQVKRLYVGEHVMVKKTDDFDSENAPDVDVARKPKPSRGTLDPENYVPPQSGFLDPDEEYTVPLSETN